jgi:ketosteroid isomerase-like protein
MSRPIPERYMRPIAAAYHRVMLRRLIIAALIASPVLAGPPDATESVRQSEIAFAKAFADRDRDRFFKFVLDDATFLGPFAALEGKEKIAGRWSRFFESKEAPFSWTPERVETNAAGTIGLSTGPVFDAKGAQSGNYSSIWLKQADGSWKILFDGPGAPPVAIEPTPFEEGDLAADDGVRLHYRKFGDGPIKLVAPLDSVVHDFFKYFGDVATVITYDVRKGERSQQDVSDLEAVRKYFKLDKFIPAGYSDMGETVALYAMDHPDRVQRLVQLQPAPPRLATEKMNRITMPVLTIHRTKDGGREWAAGLPNARLVPIEGAAAQSWSDAPAAVMAAIREFIRGGWPLGAEKVMRAER